MTSAVVNGVWVQSSVSQLKTASACLLKWHYDKKQGLPKKRPSKGNQIGTEGHTELELYLTGRASVMGPLARAGLRFLPKPVHSLMVERRFDGKPRGDPFDPSTAVLFAGGVPLDGYIDVVNGNALALANPYELPGTGYLVRDRTLILTDHKFSKLIEPRDEGGYAALAEDLADVQYEHGIQMIGYAEWARLALLPQVSFDRILLQHIYYNNGLSRATPAARTVWTIVDLETVQREWFKVNSLARSVVDVAKETDVLKVPYNEASCEAYGGCDFANVCPRSPLNRYLYTEPETQEDSMSIVNSLIAQQQLVPVAQQTLPLPPAPPPATLTAPVAVPGWIAAGQAKLGQVYFVQSAGRAATFLGAGIGGSYLFENNGQPFAVPSEAAIFLMAPPPVAPQAAPGTATVGTDSAGRPVAAVLPPDAPASTPLTSAEPTKAEAAPVEEKPKDYKKPKAKRGIVIIDESTSPDVKTTSIPAQQQSALVEEPLKDVAPTTTVDSAAPIATGFAAIKLYIGCRPDSGAARLDDYVNFLIMKLCEKYQTKDPVLSDHPDMAYGKWKSMLRRVVAVSPPAAGSYYTSGRGEFTDVIVPALIALLPVENVVRAG